MVVTTYQPAVPVVTYVPERRGLFGLRTAYRPTVSYAVPVASAQVVTVAPAAPVVSYYAPAPATPVVSYYAPAPTVTVSPAPVVTTYAPVVPNVTYYAPSVSSPAFSPRFVPFVP